MVNAGLQRIFGSCSWIKTHFFGNPGKEIVFFFLRSFLASRGRDKTQFEAESGGGCRQFEVAWPF